MPRKMFGSWILLIHAVSFTVSCAAMAIEDVTVASKDLDLFTVEKINVDGKKRTAIVGMHNGKNDKPAPLLIMLHGGGGSAKSMVRMSQVMPAALKDGYIVVFPQGRGIVPGFGTWNVKACCAYAMKNSVDDISFIDDVIAMAIERYGVDPSRVYLAGLSNGGMMTHYYASQRPGKLAAIGVVAGAVFPSTPQPKGRVPVMLIHGAADEIVPFDGGNSNNKIVRRSQNQPFSPFAEGVSRWRQVNGCNDNPSKNVEDVVTHDIYDGCEAGGALETYVIADGKHAWPGGEPGREAADQPSKALLASEALISFFNRHKK